MICTLGMFKPKVKFIYLHLALSTISLDRNGHFDIDPQAIFFYSQISKKQIFMITLRREPNHADIFKRPQNHQWIGLH